MKNKHLSVLIALFASPLVLLGSSTTDRKIEEAARASYNYRTVLEDNVKVKAQDGVVTLTGTVQDKDDKALAADTVENLPGVTSVRNNIVVKSTYPEKSDGWIALKIRGRGQGRSRPADRHRRQPRAEGTHRHLCRRDRRRENGEE